MAERRQPHTGHWHIVTTVPVSVSHQTSSSMQTEPQIVHCCVPSGHHGAGQRLDRQTGTVVREAVDLIVLRHTPGFPG